MSHRSLRSILIPVVSGIAAAIAVSWLSGGPCAWPPGGYNVAGSPIQAGNGGRAPLHVTQAWETTEGAGITVAVLGTGVAARHPDLAGP